MLVFDVLGHGDGLEDFGGVGRVAADLGEIFQVLRTVMARSPGPLAEAAWGRNRHSLAPGVRRFVR